jgi:hypothetical protein
MSSTPLGSNKSHQEHSDGPSQQHFYLFYFFQLKTSFLLVHISCIKGAHCDISMYIMRFDHIHPLCYSFLSLLLPLFFKQNFNRFHYDIFICAYNVL